MVTQERDMTEFGSHTGRVIRFFNRKGFGFIHDLNDNQDYEVVEVFNGIEGSVMGDLKIVKRND